MNNYKVVLLNGKPHIASSSTLYNEPVLVTHHWPLPAATGYVQGGEPVYYHLDGWFTITLGPHDHKKFQLPQGGKTDSVLTIEREFFPPKTRCELRYHNGR